MCAKTVHEYSEEMDTYLVAPGSIDETLDFASIFGHIRPVEIEIGTGKGRFILAESLKRPDTDFLGIERSQKWLRIALWRVAKLPRDNCQFLCLDADFVVRLLIQSHSITAYHVYFPDPWPKDRHHKRRLFHKRFNQKLAETLIPHGKLHLKTDHQDYFEYACESILDSGVFEQIENKVSDEMIETIEEAEDTATHFEIKFRKEARHIHSAVFQAKI